MALSESQRSIIKQQTDEFLCRSKSFKSLSAEKQREITRNTSKVLELLAEDAGSTGAVFELLGNRKPYTQAKDPYAVGLEEQLGRPGDKLVADRSQYSPNGPPPPAEFGTGLMTGIQGAGQLMSEVDFPVFVAELIRGVFQAIVDASIQQMQAYSELVQSVALSLNEFRDQNVTENQARDQLVSQYPNLMQMSFEGDTPKVIPREEAMFADLPDFASEFGLEEEVTELDEETIEKVLVPAVRNNLAARRQKLLATMVLMGINRIIVTDGRINAKVRFTFAASDTMHQTRRDIDWKKVGETQFGYSTSNRWTSGEFRYSQPVIKLANVTDTETDAQLQAAASLTGEVSIKFRSETLPLERLVDNDQVVRLNEVQAGAGRGVRAQRAQPPSQQSQTPAATPAT